MRKTDPGGTAEQAEALPNGPRATRPLLQRGRLEEDRPPKIINKKSILECGKKCIKYVQISEVFKTEVGIDP